MSYDGDLTSLWHCNTNIFTKIKLNLTAGTDTLYIYIYILYFIKYNRNSQHVIVIKYHIYFFRSICLELYVFGHKVRGIVATTQITGE